VLRARQKGELVLLLWTVMSLNLERSDRGIRSNEMPSLGSLFLYFSGVKCPTGRQPGLCSPGAPLASEEMPHVEERFSG
jgi:hypothetical protein